MTLLIILLAALLASAFFSGVEAVFISLDRVALNRLERLENFSARLARFLHKRFSSLIITVLMMNIFSNIVATIFGTRLIMGQQDFLMGLLPGAWVATAIVLSEGIFLLSFSLFVVIFCEFLPKRIFVKHTLSLTMIISWCIAPLYVLLFPITWPLSWGTRYIVSRLHISSASSALGEEEPAGIMGVRASLLPASEAELFMKKLPFQGNEISEKNGKNSSLASASVSRSPHSLEDTQFFNTPFDHGQFLSYLKLSTHTGVLKEAEFALLKNFVTYKNMEVRSFMIPRELMEGIDLGKKRSLRELRKAIIQFPYKNIPFYRTQKDNIVGTISQEKYAFSNTLLEFTSVRALEASLDKPPIIPETKNILDALEDLLDEHSEVALVGDEYGGIEGLVTYDDILFKFFGRVSSPGQESGEHSLIERSGKGFFKVDAHVTLSEVNEYFGISLQSDYAETLGGYVTEHLKKLPKRYDALNDENFEYTVQECTEKKIIALVLKPVPAERGTY